VSVVGAGRLVLAGGRPHGRDEALVEADGAQGCRSHLDVSAGPARTPARSSSDAVAERRRGKSAAAAFVFAERTQSKPWFVGRARTVSRRRRRTRLRTMALPRRLLVTKPKRLWSESVGKILNTRRSLLQVRPLAKTASKSLRWRSLICLGKPNAVLRFHGPPAGSLGAGVADQTESRHLPLRVRRFRMALPVLVRLRFMKPCRRARRLFFG